MDVFHENGNEIRPGAITQERRLTVHEQYDKDQRLKKPPTIGPSTVNIRLRQRWWVDQTKTA